MWKFGWGGWMEDLYKYICVYISLKKKEIPSHLLRVDITQVEDALRLVNAAAEHDQKRKAYQQRVSSLRRQLVKLDCHRWVRQLFA